MGKKNRLKWLREKCSRSKEKSADCERKTVRVFLITSRAWCMDLEVNRIKIKKAVTIVRKFRRFDIVSLCHHQYK